MTRRAKKVKLSSDVLDPGVESAGKAAQRKRNVTTGPRRGGAPLSNDMKRQMGDLLNKLEASVDGVEDAKAKMMDTTLEPEKRAAVASLVKERDELLGQVKTIRGSVEGPKAPWIGRFEPGDVFTGSEEEFQALLARTAMGSKEGGAA